MFHYCCAQARLSELRHVELMSSHRLTAPTTFSNPVTLPKQELLASREKPSSTLAVPPDMRFCRGSRIAFAGLSVLSHQSSATVIDAYLENDSLFIFPDDTGPEDAFRIVQRPVSDLRCTSISCEKLPFSNPGDSYSYVVFSFVLILNSSPAPRPRLAPMS